MKTRLIVGCTLAVSLSTAVLSADERWKKKPYTEWTLEDVRNLLENSPWSHTKRTSSGGLGQTGSGMSATKQGGFTTITPATEGRNSKGQREVRPGTATVRPPASAPGITGMTLGGGTIQWQSSFTVRQALARLETLQGATRKEQASDPLATSAREYVIAVSGDYLAKMLADVPFTEDVILQSAYLRLKQTKAVLHPDRVAWDRTFFPAVLFYFPKESDGHPAIGPTDKEIEFRWTLGKNHVETTFHVLKMTRDGKPDL